VSAIEHFGIPLKAGSQNGRRREQKAFKPLQDYLKLFLGHNAIGGILMIR
jgi:hypothetical protein